MSCLFCPFKKILLVEMRFPRGILISLQVLNSQQKFIIYNIYSLNKGI